MLPRLRAETVARTFTVPTDDRGQYLCCAGTDDVHMPGCPVPDLLAENDHLREGLHTWIRAAQDAESERDRLREALRHLYEFGVRLMNSEVMEERGIGCCVAEGSRIAIESRTTEGTER